MRRRRRRRRGEDDYDIDGDGYGYDEADGDDEGDSEDGDGEGDNEGKSEGVNRGQGDINSKSNSKPGRGAGGLGRADVPVSETDETWQRKSEEIVKSENSTFVYLTMPTVNYDKAIHDFKTVIADWRDEVAGKKRSWHGGGLDGNAFSVARQHMIKWKMKEKETISFMVKEFEQRKAAELYARINIAKTGVIDTNKLHSYKYNDDIFRRLATIPKGKNHGFVMFLDWSGSMAYGLDSTMKQLFSLCLFCKQIGVPFEVYAFKDAASESPFSYLNKQNVIKGDRLVLRNFLSSRMNTEELNFAMTVLWHCSHGNYLASDGMGGTPLNDAIMISPKIVQDFTVRNKLEITNVIWLTDGESNGAAGVANETTPNPGGYRSSRRYFYTDKETGKTYDYEPYGWSSTRNNTATLLRILKDKTGCNLVGFLLYNGSFSRVNNEFNVSNGNPEAYNVARKYWSDNKYYPIKSAGYDEYYIIDVRAMQEDKNELAIDNTGDKKMTVRRMATAFSKFAQKKTVNRVLLRSFVDRIAKHGMSTKKSA